jgi:Tfp pilus assembly protein PilX
MKYSSDGEKGSVMIMAILILALLTIIGICSSNTSVMESRIVRNMAIRKQNFYRAESAVMVAAQALEDLKNTTLLDSKDRNQLNTSGCPWLINDNSVDMTSRGNWDSDQANNDDNAAVAAIDPTNNTRFAVVRVNVAKKSSLGMENPDQLYEYAVYGLCSDNSGEAFIEAGFKKRY